MRTPSSVLVVIKKTHNHQQHWCQSYRSNIYLTVLIKTNYIYENINQL